MGLHRGIDESEPIRPIGDEVSHEEHRAARTGIVAVGTLACPSCDASSIKLLPCVILAPISS